MSLPNLTNNIMQSQNIVLNQVPLSHAIMANVNASNGIPIATAIQQSTVDQSGIQTVPVQGASPVKTMQVVNTQPAAESSLVLTKTRMADLVRDIDPNIYLEDDVEEMLLTYVDDFVDRVLNGASLVAKHRHVNTIEVKDVQHFINRNYNMWVPGFGTDEMRPYKRSLTTEAHKQRLALIRKTLKKY